MFWEVLGEMATGLFFMVALPMILQVVFEAVVEKWGMK